MKTEETNEAYHFLPVSRADLDRRGIRQPDFVYISGDAYVDHSSFGSAIICRLLEDRGYTVGMIPQPDWKDPASIEKLGEPRLAFLVSSGNMDSMVNHYTVAKHRRRSDAYSPGGVMGKRPDRAVIVYCNLIRRVYKKTPIIIGGLEASLRRLGHYDYWSDKVRRSILLESGADLISYGMGEHSIVQIAEALDAGIAVKDITYIEGTVYKTRKEEDIYDGIRLPDFEEICADKKAYARSFRIQYENTDPFAAKRIYEVYDHAICVVQNPPAKPLTQMEMDDVYNLPYMRRWHPMYDAAGGIPAFAEIRFSITSNRGCFGGCNFCALTFHQGRIIQSRSRESIVEEAKTFEKDPTFKGYIHDVGGPTGDFRQPACEKQLKSGACVHKQCLFPEPCKNLRAEHAEYRAILKELRQLPGIRKVFIRSGIRFDYVLADPDGKKFLEDLCRYHISGQLRTAPEHVSDRVLDLMGKPHYQVYEKFCREFEQMNRKIHKQQYIVPYLMSSHPGSTLKDAIILAEYLHAHHLNPEQVQDFYPTPGTVSTCMYYTGINPLTGQKVYVARNPHEKAMQRALIQYRRPENYDLVKEALLKEGREDLIGFGEKCLIPPRKIRSEEKHGKSVDRGRKNPDGGKREGKGRKNPDGGKREGKGRKNPDGAKRGVRERKNPDGAKREGKGRNNSDRHKTEERNRNKQKCR